MTNISNSGNFSTATPEKREKDIVSSETGTTTKSMCRQLTLSSVQCGPTSRVPRLLGAAANQPEGNGGNHDY